MNENSEHKPTREEYLNNLTEAEKLINKLHDQWDKVEAYLEEKYSGKREKYDQQTK